MAPTGHGMKHMLKSAVKPLAEPLTARLEEFRTDIVDLRREHDELAGDTRRLERRALDLEKLYDRLDALEAYVPQLLGVVASQNVLLREIRRRESAAAPPVERGARPEILNQAALEAPVLRVNVGDGAPAEGHVNVGPRRDSGVDVLADAGSLPFDPGSVEAIRCFHVLERFTREQLAAELLPYWRGLLTPGGVFTAVVSDAEALFRACVDGELSIEDVNAAMPGDCRLTLFSPDTLAGLVTVAGFTDVKVTRGVGGAREMEVRAVKSGAGSEA